MCADHAVLTEYICLSHRGAHPPQCLSHSLTMTIVILSTSLPVRVIDRTQTHSLLSPFILPSTVGEGLTCLIFSCSTSSEGHPPRSWPRLRHATGRSAGTTCIAIKPCFDRKFEPLSSKFEGLSHTTAAMSISPLYSIQDAAQKPQHAIATQRPGMNSVCINASGALRASVCPAGLAARRGAGYETWSWAVRTPVRLPNTSDTSRRLRCGRETPASDGYRLPGPVLRTHTCKRQV